MIRQRTLIALALYRSVLLFISFISELVTMITCKDERSNLCTLNYRLVLKASSNDLRAFETGQSGYENF